MLLLGVCYGWVCGPVCACQVKTPGLGNLFLEWVPKGGRMKAAEELRMQDSPGERAREIYILLGGPAFLLKRARDCHCSC